MTTSKRGSNKAGTALPKAAPAAPAGGTNGAAAARAPARQQRLRFRTDDVKSSYCNMANVTSTREEVVLNFGVNQNWDQPADAERDLEVDIQPRVILSPFAAKRLTDALTQLMRDYEARHGALG